MAIAAIDKAVGNPCEIDGDFRSNVRSARRALAISRTHCERSKCRRGSKNNPASDVIMEPQNCSIRPRSKSNLRTALVDLLSPPYSIQDNVLMIINQRAPGHAIAVHYI